MKQPSSIIAALSLLEKKDESNTLGLAFAKHDSIATGKKIGRAGECAASWASDRMQRNSKVFLHSPYIYIHT